MSRRIVTAVSILGVLLLTAGCGTIYMDAPASPQVRLLPKDAPVSVRVEKKVWFKWWGKEPLDPEAPYASAIIREHRLKEARIRMTNTVGDGIVSAITGIVGFPRRTLIVEGNP